MTAVASSKEQALLNPCGFPEGSASALVAGSVSAITKKSHIANRTPHPAFQRRSCAGERAGKGESRSIR